MDRCRLTVRAADPGERESLLGQLRERWGASGVVVSRGRRFELRDLPALVCVAGTEAVGVATYRLEHGQCRLVTLDAFVEDRGVGSALLERTIELARAHGCRRLWLITTNDNFRALGFYQRRGLRLAALHRGAVGRARELKPEIPAVGERGIRISDELELELPLR